MDSSSFAINTLGLSKKAVKTAQENTEILPGRAINDAAYPENVTRDKTPEGMGHMFKHFYSRSTYQCSGATHEKARIMDMEYFEWEALLQSQWPDLLREVAQAMPHLVPKTEDMPPTGWTDFQANMLSAVRQVPADAAGAQEARRVDFLTKYCNHLARLRGCLPPLSKQEKRDDQRRRRLRTASRRSPEAFDAETYAIAAPRLETFRVWLKQQKLRYTRFRVPHPCPLCTAGPTDEVVFVALSRQKADFEIAGKPVPRELAKKCTSLRKSLRNYRVHLDQLETARSEAKAVEDNLKPGECMIIRDFVNHHDHSGSHVKCLHWVLMWRDTVDGPIKRLKLRHYCSDPKSMMTDSYYQADITDFHLNEQNPHCPKLLVKFTTIYFVGDHGPHFASHDTMHNESTLSRRYNKTIKIMFLASYHAYSRADASGSEDSTALRRDMRMGLPRFGAAAMAEMTNSSHDGSSWAYTFPAINRNLDVFPPSKHFAAKDRAKWIKKWCEIRYIHPSQDAKYDGILQYRLVTGVGAWQWTDLVANKRMPEDTMCDACSTKADAIVYHVPAQCPAPGYIHDLPVFQDLLPDPARIKGPQVGRKKGKQAVGKATITYPCKYNDCERKNRRAFRLPQNANRHMRIEHKPTDTEFEALGYPEDLAPTTDRAKHKRPKPKTKAPRAVANSSADDEIDSGDQSPPSRRSSASESESEPNNSANPANSDEHSTDEDVPLQEEKRMDSEEHQNELVDMNEDQYEVEEILKHRFGPEGAPKYYIAWKNTDIRTWEPPGSLTSHIVKEYHTRTNAAKAVKNKAEVNRRQAADAATEASGMNVRSRRSQPSKYTHVQRTEMIEDQADEY